MTSTVKRILIIDDNHDDLDACIRTFSKSTYFDYQISVETNPENGLEQLQSIDCVVIDYQFPQMTGLDLLKRIKASHPLMPVIVLTGQTDETLAVALLKAGAVDYISKSALLLPEFDERVANAIENSHLKGHLNYVASDGIVNVLITDDNIDDIDLCQRLLKKCGDMFSIKTTTRSTDVHGLLEKYEIDCLLIDYSMPGKTGIDILYEVQSRYPHVAVVVMTGQGNEQIAVNAIKGGAENYLVKNSFTADALSSSITQAVDKKRMEKHLQLKERDLQEREVELQDANGFLKLILSTMPNYIFVKDEEFRIVQANDAFLGLYPESKRSALTGTTTLEDYDEKEAHDILAMDRLAFENGFSETFESIHFPNGELRTLHTTKTRFENSRGQRFILGVANDVTERENLVSRLSKSNSDLEDFAYIASHDLKSPLNAINNLVDWIDEDFASELPEKASEYFGLIKGRASRMGKLLDDLLQYSRVQATLVDEEVVSMASMKKEIIELVDTSKALTLDIKGDNLELPKMALQLVLVNLVSNAIKHHDKNAVSVCITVVDKRSAYHISVTDDGPGISFQYAEKIFQMFQTLKPRDQVEGSGMGLAMVSKVLEYYQGSIALEKREQRGACFNLRWPKYQLNSHKNKKVVQIDKETQ